MGCFRVGLGFLRILVKGLKPFPSRDAVVVE